MQLKPMIVGHEHPSLRRARRLHHDPTPSSAKVPAVGRHRADVVELPRVSAGLSGANSEGIAAGAEAYAEAHVAQGTWELLKKTCEILGGYRKEGPSKLLKKYLTWTKTTILIRTISDVSFKQAPQR